MIRDTLLVLAYVSFLGLGFVAPFVFTLGYLWVDTFRPQEISWGFLSSVPVSMIMAVAALLGYLVLDRKNPPPIRAQTVLCVLLAIWVTFTTTIAVAPGPAWTKWDWAFKTILFSTFIPFVIRSRLQIEAFLQIYVFALAVHFVAAGGKALLGGGGYGRTLSAAGNTNSGLAEGSTLAAVSVMLVPLIIYLARHTILIPKMLLTRLMYIGLIVVAIASAVGTYARTGLIGMVVLAGALWLTTKRKLLTGTIIALAALVIAGATTATWNSRISTISDYQTESSALGRILVWKWTLDFVKTHPLGGGFHAYLVNEIVFPPSEPEKEPVVARGKAFHSIYFEILGEHGYPGMAIFLGLVTVSFASLFRVIRRTRGVEEFQWCYELGKTLMTSLVVLLACGAFIGIAFQPMLYYMFALSASLSTLVSRSPALAPQLPTGPVHRSLQAAAPALPVRAAWRR